MDRPRKHHFLPQFYLKGFTDSGGQDGSLHVFDHTRAKVWKTTPANAAHQRDFYEVEPGGKTDSAAFEGLLATLESRFAPVVQGIIETQCLPDGEGRNLLMNFLTMMALTVPATRRAMEDINDELHKRLLREQIATPEGWQELKGCIRAAGRELDSAKEAELRKFIESSDYRITQGQNWYLKMIGNCLAACPLCI